MAKDEDYAEAQPMIEWANSVPRGDLAVEVMAVLLSGQSFNTQEIKQRLFRLPTERWSVWSGYPPNFTRALEQVEIPVREALQLLEHAELVYGYVNDGQPFWDWRATHLGLTTCANGKDAVTQRIKDRTGL